jgi:hypothetical protein
MLKKLIYCALLVEALLLTPAAAQEAATETGAAQQATTAAQPAGNEAPKVDSDVKELSGISIIGNEEAPKSLYIVPWQNSEVGVATSLQSGLFDDSMRPLQREVFMRELDYYELSH